MRSNKKVENKVFTPETPETAAEKPAVENKVEKEQKTVRVQVKPNRAVTGIGGAGATKRINSQLAKDLEDQGLVDIL